MATHIIMRNNQDRWCVLFIAQAFLTGNEEQKHLGIKTLAYLWMYYDIRNIYDGD